MPDHILRDLERMKQAIGAKPEEKAEEPKPSMAF